MIAKFADHLPLYRHESIFGRAGLAIPRSTLAQWVGMTGEQLQPLVDALRDVVIGQQVVHADETPVQMLSPGSKRTTALMFERTPSASSAKQPLSFMTSAPVVPVNMLVTSCKAGKESWFATILPVIRPASNSA